MDKGYLSKEDTQIPNGYKKRHSVVLAIREM
jgi:hypothetical protein